MKFSCFKIVILYIISFSFINSSGNYYCFGFMRTDWKNILSHIEIFALGWGDCSALTSTAVQEGRSELKSPDTVYRKMKMASLHLQPQSYGEDILFKISGTC